MHAGYVCRHSGRCCTSNWPIALTPAEADRVRAALGGTGIDRTPDGTLLLGRQHGACVFHSAAPAGGCGIQQALGHAALPLECRQFPRQSLTDPRGTAVTLSHYCPTARTLLDTATAPVTILENPDGFPPGGEYIGLRADPDLPPLLHPRRLLDWDGWWAIERAAVSLLSGEPETGLPRLAAAVEHLRRWQPGRGPLSTAINSAFGHAAATAVSPWHPPDELVAEHVTTVREAVPHAWRAEADAALAWRGPALPPAVVGRFLAAHAFANWAAQTGHGLRTWYRSIEAAGCLARLTEDPGRVDLVLRHLADSSALIARWSRLEDRPLTRQP